MRFTKMHGAGNDYVYIDCFDTPAPGDPSTLARAVGDRHRGIGSDGLILIGPSETADARMQMWNADGSRAEMCGNGIRCVAKYLYDHRSVRRDELRIETDCGVSIVWPLVENGRVAQVRVNMGRPIVRAAEIPTTLRGDPPVDVPLILDGGSAGGRRLQVTCVSMGNPHCVVFVDEPNDQWVRGIGPLLEKHPAFPNRVNAEFVQVVSPEEIVARVWERGTGETLACGTGACAALVAGALSGRTARNVVCRLPGGDLRLQWEEGCDVYLTGPAVEVFVGEWPEDRSSGHSP